MSKEWVTFFRVLLPALMLIGIVHFGILETINRGADAPLSLRSAEGGFDGENSAERKRDFGHGREGKSDAVSRSRSEPITGIIQSQEFSNLIMQTKGIVSNLRNSDDPDALVNRLVSEIQKCSMIEREILWSDLISRLATHDRSDEALEFVMKFRSSLFGPLSSNQSENGSHSYDDLITRLYEESTKNGDPLEDLVREKGNQDILEDFGPIFLAGSGQWKSTLFDSSAESGLAKNQILQKKTLNLLAKKNSTTQKAFDMLMSPDCTVFHDENVLKTVISKSWFLSNAETILRNLENAPSSPNRDHALGRVVELLVEVDRAKASEWLELIDDENLRREVGNGNVEKNR